MKSIIIIFFMTTLLWAQQAFYSLSFDGIDDYVDCGSDTSLNMSDGLTIMAWVKGGPENVNYARIVDKYNYFAQQGYNLVREPATNSIMLDFWATDGSKHTCVAQTPVFDNKWHYVAASYDGDTVKVYVDGNLENQLVTGQKTIRACSDNFLIGNGFDGNIWFPFKGQIEEVRLVNAETAQGYINYYMHQRDALIDLWLSRYAGLWEIDEGSGTFTADAGLMDNNGVLTQADSTSAWHKSTSPRLENQNPGSFLNTSAVWAAKDSASSGILSVACDSIPGDANIVFGNNDQEPNFQTLSEPGIFGITKELSTIWKTQILDTLAGRFIFDVRNLNFSDAASLLLLINESDTLHGSFNQTDSIFVVDSYKFYDDITLTLASSETAVSIDDESVQSIPDTPYLFQNYPNPFNPKTNIEYSLGANHNLSVQVELSVYDLLGHKVATLFSGKQETGKYTVNFNGEGLTSGVYFYILKTGSSKQIRKMLLLR